MCVLSADLRMVIISLASLRSFMACLHANTEKKNPADAEKFYTLLASIECASIFMEAMLFYALLQAVSDDKGFRGGADFIKC